VEKYFDHELVEKAVKEHGLVGIFNTQVHPNVTKRWVGYGGKIMWYNVALDGLHQSKSLSRYLIHMTNGTVVSVPWGQVFGYGYGLCYLMGYSPIICYGFDCGFKEDDKIEDTPYWNPYYKATAQEMIWEKMGYKYTFGSIKKCEHCNTVLPTAPYKIWNFNQNDPRFQEQFMEAAKSFPFDISYEYTGKTPPEMYNQEAKALTIRNHFHFYSNPFGNKTYHDNIFKAYKDIMTSFFIGNPQAKVIQASEYTTLFAQTCITCKGSKKVNKEVEDVKECYKCHVKRVEKSKGELMDCPRCKKFMGKNDKGELILESCGIEANNVQCITLEDYINSKLVV
jgi:ribosomal protein L37AE/L43A